MAGSYPDPPSHRLAYQLDGTSVLRVDADNRVYQASTSHGLNDENDSSPFLVANGAGYMAFVFGTLRDLDGIFMAGHDGVDTRAATVRVEVSGNTTNGVDGSWTQVLGATVIPAGPGATRPGYRNSIISLSSTRVRGVRIRMVSAVSTSTPLYLQTVHLYAREAAGVTPYRLAIWDPTLNQRLSPAALDFGNVARSGGTVTRTFRVRNTHTTATADNVTVRLYTSSDATPSLLGQFTLSTDGTTFVQPTITVGSLGPGANSGVLHLRYTASGSAELSVWTLFMSAWSSSWTYNQADPPWTIA